MEENLLSSTEKKAPIKKFGKRSERRAKMLNEDVVIGNKGQKALEKEESVSTESNEALDIQQKEESVSTESNEAVEVQPEEFVSTESNEAVEVQPEELVSTESNEAVEVQPEEEIVSIESDEDVKIQPQKSQIDLFDGPILFADDVDDRPVKTQNNIEYTGPILFADGEEKTIVDKQTSEGPILIADEDKKSRKVKDLGATGPILFADHSDEIQVVSAEEDNFIYEDSSDVPIILLDDENEKEEKPHTLFEREDSFTGKRNENPVIQEKNFQQEVILEPEETEELKEEKHAEEIEYVYKEGFDFKEEDLFYEKKGFLMTQYEKIQDYLEQKSLEGYHFVRKVGKKYFFIEDDKEHYYYSINYFSQEPREEQWSEWEKLGWEVVSHSPSKYKKEAGWFYFRHKENENEYHKTIDNEEEKYNFFRRYANSARSTLFLICICMIVCIVAAYLQWEMKAMLISLLVCALIFAIAFILFFVYLRMLLTNRKIAKKLRVQLRLKARRQNFHGEDYQTETDTQLDTDWNRLENSKK